MRPLHALPFASLLAVGSGSVGAETLYNQDGVQLSATVRSIDPGAATCRIREERHTAEQFEKLKANEGQPLNVWRVDLEVANYSGKALDYLNVHLNVESDWPPCDHWDGPEGSYGEPVVWTGPLMSIQDVGTVEPGEEVRETAFVLAWHEKEPALGRWDINYDFAAAAPAAGAAAEAKSDSAGTGGAAAAPEREVAGTAEAPASGARGLPAGIRPNDTCVDNAIGASCWMEIANQQGCYVWNNYLQEDDAATWSGDCNNGLAAGYGSLEWSYTRRFRGSRVQDGSTRTGELRDGKKHGHWTERDDDGYLSEGPYLDGRRHGHWRIEGTDGGFLSEGPYLDGRRHGRWTGRSSNGPADRCMSVTYSEGTMVEEMDFFDC